MSVNSVEEFRKNQQEEADKNYAFFLKLLSKDGIPKEHYGQYALIKNCEITGYYSTWEDALSAGELAFKDRLFSIQDVPNSNTSLGYVGYAIY